MIVITWFALLVLVVPKQLPDRAEIFKQQLELIHFKMQRTK